MAEKLNAGDTFPRMTIQLLGGNALTIPDDLESKYTLVLFYRGHW